MNTPEYTQVPVRTLGRMHDRIAAMEAALRTVVRMADAAKEPCGMDPESAPAIRNGKFAGIAQVAAQGLGWVQAPTLATTEFGWLIENGKQAGAGLAYRYIDNDGGGSPAWTEDHSKALRFARREDAEQFAHHDEDAWRIVEHAWDTAGVMGIDVETFCTNTPTGERAKD